MAKQDQDRQSRKWGDQALKSYGSLGLEEMRNALYNGGTIAQQATEPGMWGDRSYGDLVEDRMKATGKESSLSEKIRQAEFSRSGHEREPEDLSREQ